MKKVLLTVTLMAILVLVAPTSLQASSHDGTEPVGACPPSFDHMHQIEGHNQHDGDHGSHKHVGSEDQNGDGWVCVKHVGKDGKVHEHADNNFPP